MIAFAYLVGTFSVFYSLISIIYPLKPYKNRKYASIGALVCFVGLVIIGNTLGPTEKQTIEMLTEAELLLSQNEPEKARDLIREYKDREKFKPLYLLALKQIVESVPINQSKENLKLYKELAALEPNMEKHTEKVKFYKEKEELRIRQEKANKEHKVKVDNLISEVTKIPASNFDRNLSIYKQLNSLEPKNKNYISKIAFYEQKKQEFILLKRKEREEAKKRYTGIWKVGRYVDDFGEPTNQKYITNRPKIRGTFSNTATQDSALDVEFLIEGPKGISLMLYEYAGNNPVKAYSKDDYRVLVKDAEGHRITFTVSNYSDRLQFRGSDAQELHKMLTREGIIKFRIIEIDTPTTNYSFSIISADGYNNAYRKLSQNK